MTKKQKLKLPLEKLELSHRAYNHLKDGAKISTLGDLVVRSEADLLGIKNFGRKSLTEIKEVLALMGLSLGMRFDQHGRLVPPAPSFGHKPPPSGEKVLASRRLGRLAKAAWLYLAAVADQKGQVHGVSVSSLTRFLDSSRAQARKSIHELWQADVIRMLAPAGKASDGIGEYQIIVWPTLGPEAARRLLTEDQADVLVALRRQKEPGIPLEKVLKDLERERHEVGLEAEPTQKQSQLLWIDPKVWIISTEGLPLAAKGLLIELLVRAQLNQSEPDPTTVPAPAEQVSRWWRLIRARAPALKPVFEMVIRRS